MYPGGSAEPVSQDERHQLSLTEKAKARERCYKGKGWGSVFLRNVLHCRTVPFIFGTNCCSKLYSLSDVVC